MAIRYQLPRETAVDKILNAANVFLDKELDRKQRREETEANRQFREQQLDSLNDYRDEQTEFRDKQFQATEDYRDQQLQRSDESILINDIDKAETLDSKTNMFKVMKNTNLSANGKKRYDLKLASHLADVNDPIRQVIGFRNVPGIETAWEASGIPQKPNITYEDKAQFFKNFMSDRKIFSDEKSSEIARSMAGFELAEKNLKITTDLIETERNSLIFSNEKITNEEIQDKLEPLYVQQKRQQQSLDRFSSKAFSALSEAGLTMPGIISSVDNNTGAATGAATGTAQTGFFPYTGGSIVPTFDQVKSDSTYIGSFILPDGGQASIDSDRQIELNVPKDFDPNKNFEQEDAVNVTGDIPELASNFGTSPVFEGMSSRGLQLQGVPNLQIEPPIKPPQEPSSEESNLLNYSGNLDYSPNSQSPPVSSVSEGDDVNAISRLASSGKAEPYGLTDLFSQIGDVFRQSSATQKDIGTGSGNIMSMGGATKDQINAVRNAETNLKRIDMDLLKLTGRGNSLSQYKSEEEYLSLNNSKNKQFQSYLININQAIQQPNLTNPVKNRLTKTLDKYILKVDKAVTRAERSGGDLSTSQKPVYNKETVALVNAIKTGQVLPEESVAVLEEGGMESTLKQAFENLDPNEKQVYGNDFEAYRAAYVNRIKNMITYGKMDESQGEEILQQFQ